MQRRAEKSSSSKLTKVLRLPADVEWRSHPEVPAGSLDLKRVTAFIQNPSTISPKDLLKQGKRRLVFLIKAADNSTEFVVKAFPLEGFREQMKHSKYAESEAKNLEEAAARALPVPKILAWGWEPTLAGHRWNAVVMERIKGRPMRVLLEPGSHVDRPALLKRAWPLFEKMYRAGCNHIDFGPDAIIISPTDAGSDRMIDFQYCTFKPAPDPTLLVRQAGYFAWVLTTQKNLVDVPTLHSWFLGLLKLVEIPHTPEIQTLFEAVRREKATIEERLAY